MAVASAGHQVHVRNGTYAEHVTVPAGVALRSESGNPQHAIIDATDNGRCVYLVDAESSVTGFGLRNGFVTYYPSGPYGGAVYGAGYGGPGAGIVRDCIIADCQAAAGGGGAVGAILVNCSVSGCQANFGGGAHWSTLYNCLLHDNVANNGAAWTCTLYNCTVVNNACTGTVSSTMVNSISYNNSGGDDSLVADSYSCGRGYAGSHSLDAYSCPPGLSGYRLASYSPCRDTGNNSGWTGLAGSLDLDGNPRIYNYVVDMGAYEYGYDDQSSSSDSSSSDSSSVSSASSASSPSSESSQSFSDSSASSESSPSSLNSSSSSSSTQRLHYKYVDAASTTPSSPYSTWATAAVTIGDAMGVAVVDDVVWIRAGTYVENISIPSGVTARSETGDPVDVTIDGNGTVTELRTVTMADATSWLVGITVTNGKVMTPDPGMGPIESGGGILYGNASGCVISDNVAAYDGGSGWGGGAHRATLVDCVVSNNEASSRGGGAAECQLYNCLVSGNLSDTDGGGTWVCAHYNCTVTGNSATSGLEGGIGGATRSAVNTISYGNATDDKDEMDNYPSFAYCCGIGYAGTGSIDASTYPPLFVGGGSFRLQSGSPCKDTGDNSGWAGLAGSLDLDGNARIYNSVVDMGCWEFGSSPP